MEEHNYKFEVFVPQEHVGSRLDRFLSAQLFDTSRSQIQRWITVGAVVLNNNKIQKPDYKVKLGDSFLITIPTSSEAIPQAQHDVKLEIIYEDQDLIVINKPINIVVHPAPGHFDGTIVNGLLAHCGNSLSGIGGVKRPGIVHRLDKDTSGLMVVAKNDMAHHNLCSQFSNNNKTIKRVYWGYSWGTIQPNQGTVETFIARHPRNRQIMTVSQSPFAKKSITHYKLLKKWFFSNNQIIISKIEYVLDTGRTHQIRIHSKHLGLPLIGDSTYGKKKNLKNTPNFIARFPRQALHALKLSFIHPRNKEILNFESSLPDDLKNLEQNLKEMESKEQNFISSPSK